MPPKRNRAKQAARSQNDRRPILQNLRTTNRAEWQRIWDEHSNLTQCPVCHEDRGPNVIWDSPMNSDVPMRCPHFLPNLWHTVRCFRTEKGTRGR